MDGSISRVRIGDGTFRYRARYRDPSGRQHERRFPRKIDAQRWLDEATSALVTRTWTAPERGRVTVAEWAERWLAAQTGLKPSTHYRYGTLLRAHILPAWGNHRLADVTHADVATWVAQLRQQGSAPGTVRHAHRVFSLLLDLAVRDGRIPRNPAQRVRFPASFATSPASSPGTRSRSWPRRPGKTATSSASWPTQACASASSPRCASAGSTSCASA
jgi:hypothetical protein